MPDLESRYFPCRCGSHEHYAYMVVGTELRDYRGAIIDLAVATSRTRLGLWGRLRMIWELLTGQECWWSDVILDAPDAAALGQCLLDAVAQGGTPDVS